MFIKVNIKTEWPRGGRQDPAGAGWNPDQRSRQSRPHSLVFRLTGYSNINNNNNNNRIHLSSATSQKWD